MTTQPSMTWEQTDRELDKLFKEIYDFHELHTQKEVRESKTLSAELRAIQLRCHAVHYERIALNIARLKK